MHPKMFLFFPIMSPCTAINFSLNDIYTLANHSVSWLNLTSPCWICINSRSWGYVQPMPGYQWSTVPAQLHAVTQCTPSGHGMAVWGKGEKNFMPWYQQQLSVFTPMITSAIPPKPLFSLLTNIPQVTFPICLKSDSLTGLSVENLDNSWCGVTVRTDRENRDLEISLGYFDSAQSLGTKSSGRTDKLYLSLSMRLSLDAINQSWKSMFSSGQPKSHTHSSWFLNWAGNSDPCYSLVGFPNPEYLTLWWEPKRNTLYLEDKTQDASQHLSPFLNALTAASFAASGVMVCSQLLKDCPCSVMPCSSCKADGNPVPLWQTHFVAQLEPSHCVYYICGDKAYLSLPPFWSGTFSLRHVTPYIDLVWSNTSFPL